jgi:putative pyoverdin transport system ATP-binding/permease protein
MRFFQLIRRELQSSLYRLLIMSALAGASNAAILAAVNAGAQGASDGQISFSAIGLFLLSLVIFIKAQNYLLIATTTGIGAVIHKIQIRLMNKVRLSELSALETIGRAEIFNAVTGHTATLTQAAYSLALTGQGLTLLLLISLYILYLSPLVFALSLAIVSVAAVAIHAMNKQLTDSAAEASSLEHQLFDRLTDLLDGFKEVRLHRRRSDELFEDVVELSKVAANTKIRIQSETFQRLVFGQSVVYVLLGATVFAVPTLSDTHSETIANATLALLFVAGACFSAVQSIPIFSAANAATESIDRLEQRLGSPPAMPAAGTEERSRHFNTIEMHDVLFHYSEKAFQIGPVDFTLKNGEIVFITGSNGSGKSTFLKVLASLYEPTSGEMTFDGVLVTENTREDYRRLLTAIFSDYHLFHRLYGIPQPDVAEVDRLLSQFKLSRKTRFVGGEFSTLELSGGQRKRLALIVSLLEKRPILLLDEWTAEQDPEFRRKFYEELLPALSRARATIVMVTHDDGHLDELTFPARKLRMDEGRFVEEQTAQNGR